jgi:hypothetical protein
MFGYIRPVREELRVRDYERYQALYCGLCHAMGAKYGLFARMFLNYDFTFLAMMSYGEASPQIANRRCVARPLRGRSSCSAHPVLEPAADATVILAYWKLRDNVSDSGFWSGLPARLGSFFLKGAYRKAALAQAQFDRNVRLCLEELRALEQEKCPSLDRAADTFARILQSAAPVTEDLGRNRVAQQLLYHIGRWIYLVDAWDDLEEDRRRSRYNPILLRSEGDPEREREALRTTLRHSLNLATGAYHLGDFGCWARL